MDSNPNLALVPYTRPQSGTNIPSLLTLWRYFTRPILILQQIRGQKFLVGQPSKRFNRYAYSERPDLANPCYPITGTSVGAKRKRALLIACSYRDAPKVPKENSGELHNPWHLPNSTKDAKNLRDLLKSPELGWTDDEITILSDKPLEGDDPVPADLMPTRANILKHMQHLVQDAQAEDLLFIHFSGHGLQFDVKKEDRSHDQFEDDNKDECVWPCDYHVLLDEMKDKPDKDERNAFILDNQFREYIVDKLPTGCRCIALVDCCHSGTMFDLPYTHNSNGSMVSLHRDLSLASSVKSTVSSRFDSQLPEVDLTRKRSFGRNRERPQKAQTMPPFVYNWFELKPRSAPIFLIPHPRANWRQRSGSVSSNGTSAENEPKKRLIDDRVILGDMLCIASCEDAGLGYESPEGGMLVNSFCKIVRNYLKKDSRELTIGKLIDDIGTKVNGIYDNAIRDGRMKKHYPRPLPQLSYSRTLYLDSNFTLAL